MPPPATKSRSPKDFLLPLALLAVLVVLWLTWRVVGGSSGHSVAPESARMQKSVAHFSHVLNEAAAAPPQGDADEPRRETVSRTGVDASNHYKNAFVLFDRLTDEEKKMIRQPREEVDAEQAAQLFEKIGAILDLLREAAHADYCDWSQGPITIETPLPQVVMGQNLGKLALWAAAYQFPADPAAALATLGDRAHLGHHLADTLIGLLVQTGFERGAHELLLHHAATLEGPTAADALELLSGSTLDDNVARAFGAEQTSVEDIGQRLAKAPTETLSMLMGAANEDGAGKQAMEETLTRLASDPARLSAEIAFILELEKATAVALTLPEAEYQAWRRETEARMGEDHPLAKILLPSFTAVQTKLQQTRVERMLLRAGLEIQQHGLARLPEYRDPATGRALTYVPTPAGFELRSTYVVREKPVTMSFTTGQAAAQ